MFTFVARQGGQQVSASMTSSLKSYNAPIKGYNSCHCAKSVHSSIHWCNLIVDRTRTRSSEASEFDHRLLWSGSKRLGMNESCLATILT